MQTLWPDASNGNSIYTGLHGCNGDDGGITQELDSLHLNSGWPETAAYPDLRSAWGRRGKVLNAE